MYLGLLGTSWDVLAKSQLHTLVPCPRCRMSTWENLGQLGFTWDILGLPGTSWDIPAESQLYSLAPCPSFPMRTRDYRGYPGMSQLKVSYTSLSQMSREYLGLFGTT